jgi:hypothetical protein
VVRVAGVVKVGLVILRDAGDVGRFDEVRAEGWVDGIGVDRRG